MLIIPAIDLRGGKCVRLRQGRAEEMTVFSDDPVATGLRWRAAGAKSLTWWTWTAPSPAAPKPYGHPEACARPWISPWNWAAASAPWTLIRGLFDLGLDRLILGTVVLKDPDLAARACAEFSR